MVEERIQRRLAAILAADMVGYSRLMEADERATIARQKSYRAELIDPKITEHHGRLVKTTGDGLLVEFGSAVEAVLCALEIQQAVTEREAAVPNELRISYRVGINLGDIVIDGDDILGDGVNVAARLESLCAPGEVYVSGTVHDHVEGKLAAAFDDLGMHKVKNLNRLIHVYGLRPSTAEKPGHAGSDAVASGRQIPSIAVLPFENISGDPQQEYFADGLTEDIITALSVWRSFPVVSRNATFAYKDRALDLQQVGRDLGVEYLLEGSVRKSGDRVRVIAQLIDVEAGNYLWAQKFDRVLEDIFDVQDEITRRIAATVVPQLETIEAKRSVAKQPANLDAWDFYLRGLSFLHEATREGNRRAHEMFARALDLDPSYGPAFSGQAYLLNRDLLLDDAVSFEETAAKCLEVARKAVELDEAASISRVELVRALLWNGKHDAAIAEAKIAVENNPHNALAQFWLGAALAFAGHEEEAISVLEGALDLAPRDQRNQFFMTHLAIAYLATGQPERALKWAQLAALRPSDFIEAPLTYTSVLAHLGHEKEARSILEGIGVDHLRAVDMRPHWRRYRNSRAKERVLEGLRIAGLTK